MHLIADQDQDYQHKASCRQLQKADPITRIRLRVQAPPAISVNSMSRVEPGATAKAAKKEPFDVSRPLRRREARRCRAPSRWAAVARMKIAHHNCATETR